LDNEDKQVKRDARASVESDSRLVSDRKRTESGTVEEAVTQERSKLMAWLFGRRDVTRTTTLGYKDKAATRLDRRIQLTATLTLLAAAGGIALYSQPTDAKRADKVTFERWYEDAKQVCAAAAIAAASLRDQMPGVRERCSGQSDEWAKKTVPGMISLSETLFQQLRGAADRVILLGIPVGDHFVRDWQSTQDRFDSILRRTPIRATDIQEAVDTLVNSTRTFELMLVEELALERGRRLEGK
jgi:hypothetical protein